MACGPSKKSVFNDLASDLDETQLGRVLKDVMAQWPDLFETKPKEEWRQLLIELLDQVIERLQERKAELEGQIDAIVAASVTRCKFDQSPAHYRLLHYILKSRNGLYRGLAKYDVRQEKLTKDDMRPSRRKRDEGGGTNGRRRSRRDDEMNGPVDLSWAYEAVLPWNERPDRLAMRGA